MPWWMRSAIVMAPEGMGGAGAPPAGSQGHEDTGGAGGEAGGQTFSYIDEATDQFLADDMPQNDWEQPQQPPQPQYPEPVQVGQRPPAPQARPGQVPQQRPAPQPQAGQAPQQRPQPQVAPQPQAAPAPQSDADRQAEEVRRDPFAFQANLLQQQEASYVQALAENVYKISDADMDAFLSGDASKVSNALARVHVNAVGSAMKVVSQFMPMWVGNMLKLHQASSDAENGFWNANPGLNKTVHGKLAHATAVAYRQMNPQATTEEMHRVVGAMVAAAAGVNAGYAAPGAAPGARGVHQLPNGVRTPGRVVRNNPSAFQPAGMSAVSGARPAPQDNPWSNTAEIILADDRGAFDGQM